MNNEDKQLLENIIPIATKNMKQLLEKNKDTNTIPDTGTIIPDTGTIIPDTGTIIPDTIPYTDAISNDNPNEVVIIEKDNNNGNFSGKEKSTKITIKNGEIIVDSG
jgi:hypothetical protein